MLPIQELIHKFEEGAGRKTVLLIFGILAAITLVLVYDFREFKNLGTVEAMDSAQLARNIADGKGYTTDYIRPFSMWLLKQKATEGGTKPPPNDVYRLRDPHPDLANPPVYPMILAGWMRIVPFRYEIKAGTTFWTYQPDLMIAFLNQLFFMGGAFLVFFLGRKLFDSTVGWLAAIVFFSTEVFWRFTVSGLPTLLLMDIFLALIWVLVRLEEGVRAEQKGAGWVLRMSAIAGLLVGLGALTRYSFGWLILPVVGYMMLFLGPQRILASLVAAVLLLAVLSPWAARNYRLSGAFFGVSGYSVEADSAINSRKLEASLNPADELAKFTVMSAGRNKLVQNLTAIVRDELPRLGGSWVTGLFLAGLLIPFRSPTLSRLRVLLILCLTALSIAQALGKTYLSTDSPEITSENFLVIAAPVVFIFGVGMFCILLGQMRFTFPQAQLVAQGGFIVVAAAPLILTLMPPRTYPFMYPPYYPPVIQQVTSWVGKDELIMSDIPAAASWYGRRHAVGFTFDLENHFYEINDLHRPIGALYLTMVTLDGKLLSQMLGPDTRPWGLLLLDSVIRREVPPRFPLRIAAPGFFPDKLADQLFLTDRDRWTGRTP